MDENIKYRLVGLSFIIAIALIFLPFVFKGNKPAWEIVEDSKSFEIPTAPKNIQVALKKPKKNWLKPIKDIVIASDNKADKIIELANFKFAQQQQVVHSKAQVQIVQFKKQIKPIIIAHQDIKKKVSLTKTVKKHMPNDLNFKAKDSHQYNLQLASFSKSNHANRMLNKLEKKGFESYIKKSDSKKGRLYTVILNKKAVKISMIKQLQQQINKTFKINSLIIKQAKRV